MEAICLEQLSLYLDDLKHQETAQMIRGKGGQGRPGAGSCPQGPGRGPAEESIGGRAPGGQAFQLHRPQSQGKRAVHRGGRFRRRFSAKQGRDRRFQAILPLRGKPLNAEKKRLDQVLANEEFRSIITALGTGIGEDFDITHLKYDRVIILSDADQDGAHIRAILLTFFFRYMKRTGHRRPCVHRHAAFVQGSQGQRDDLLL